MLIISNETYEGVRKEAQEKQLSEKEIKRIRRESELFGLNQFGYLIMAVLYRRW